jgi:hypothetical protein
MEIQADALRRRIALYRRYLSEGVDAALAEIYLREIKEAQQALAELSRRDPPQQ